MMQARGQAVAPAERYDIRRFGAKPGTVADAVANAAAIQAAFDQAAADIRANAAARPGTKAVVYLPPDPAGYRISRPIFLEAGVDLIGQPGSSLAIVGGYPALLIAKRYPGFDEAHFTDAFGLLDAGAVPGRGRKFAINLAGDS